MRSTSPSLPLDPAQPAPRSVLNIAEEVLASTQRPWAGERSAQPVGPWEPDPLGFLFSALGSLILSPAELVFGLLAAG